MSLYDQQCAEEFTLIKSRIDCYFRDLPTGCPYGLPYLATCHQAMFCPLDQHIMEVFLAAGYRRNGNCLYAMRCNRCSACIPIRLHCAAFHANRNQRRIVGKNADIVVSVNAPAADVENLMLCQKFLERRYPQKNNTAEGYYDGFFLNGIVDTLRLEYRLAGRLVGAAIVDIGESWLNAVYFYFDPEEGRRSLGTFNILTLLDLCRERGIDYLYLGYYIREVAAMSYKASFKPHWLYLDGLWQSRQE